jgi:hypothetical protein
MEDSHREGAPHIYCKGSWVGPKDILGMTAQRKIPVHVRKYWGNPVNSHPPTQLRYPDSINIKIQNLNLIQNQLFKRAQISLKIKDPSLDSIQPWDS